MWLLIDSSENIKELKAGDTITFGRSNTDIVLSNDASISRNHAKLEVSTVNDNDKVIIKDVNSKYGTYLLKNNEDGKPLKITNEGYELKNNDRIRIGLRNHIFSLIFKPKIKYHVLISRVHENDKNNLQKIFDKISGKMLNSWCDSCTHLTTTKTGITEKVACALASGIPIVNINYWNDVLKAQEKKLTLPDATKYMPPLDNAFLDDKQASLSPNSLRKKIFDGLVFYHFEKKQCDLYSTMIRLAGGQSLEYNKTCKIKDCVKDNVIIVLPPDDIKTQSWSLENFQKISMELALYKLRAIPSTEIALAIFYCSTEKFCNPRFKYKKLLKSTRVSAEDHTKYPIIAEDTQGVDTSPNILKSQRIIPETVPLDSLVTENPVGKSQKRKSEDYIGASKKIQKKIEGHTNLLELPSRKIKNTELDSKKKNDLANDEIQGENQIQASIKEEILSDDDETVELAQVQKSVPKNKANDLRTQSKKNQMSNDNDRIQKSMIYKNLTVNDKMNKKTDDSTAKLRESLVETSAKKKRKDCADDIPVNDDKKNSSSASKKIKLTHNREDNNQSAWDILSRPSQAENNSRNTSKKIVKNKENILDAEEVPDSDDDSVQNIIKTSSNNFDDKNTKQKEARGSWSNEQKKRNDGSMKSGLVEFIFIKLRDTPSKPKVNSCRRNQYRIPKTRLKREDMYMWEREK